MYIQNRTYTVGSKFIKPWHLEFHFL